MICDILHIYNRCRCFFRAEIVFKETNWSSVTLWRNWVCQLDIRVSNLWSEKMVCYFCLGGTSWDVEPCRWGFVSIISATQFVEQIMIRCSRFWIFDDECLFVNGSKNITKLRSVVVSFGYQKPDLSWTGWRVSMDINSSRIWLLKSSDLYLPVLGRKNVG